MKKFKLLLAGSAVLIIVIVLIGIKMNYYSSTPKNINLNEDINSVSKNLAVQQQPVEKTNENQNILSSNSSKMITNEELSVSGIRIGSKKSEVESILGKPDKIETEYQTAYAANLNSYYYNNFGVINIVANYVESIRVDKPGVDGPRQIKIGDNIETVFQKFPYNKDAKADSTGQKIIYRSDDGCGYVTYDEDGKINDIIYDGSNKDSAFGLSIIVENDKVKSFAVFNRIN